jgi:hypothetical protein
VEGGGGGEEKREKKSTYHIDISQNRNWKDNQCNCTNSKERTHIEFGLHKKKKGEYTCNEREGERYGERDRRKHRIRQKAEKMKSKEKRRRKDENYIQKTRGNTAYVSMVM